MHPKTKRRFVVQSIEGGGWGGRPFEDGESATVSVCQGDVRNGSIEGIELKCPVVVESRALRHGLGRRRQVSAAGSASTCGCATWSRAAGISSTRGAAMPAVGPVGRQAGRAGRLSAAAARRERLQRHGRRAHPGARSAREAIVRTGGGGGWGDPLERAPQLVREDVREELISKDAALKHYGVVLTYDLSVDMRATQERRDQLRSGRTPKAEQRARP